MRGHTNTFLCWTPRILSMLFIAFLSMFAFDVFEEGLSFWGTLVALAMHLIPSFVLIAALAIAWRYEWVGATLYTAAGLLYIFWAAPRFPVSVLIIIAGPAVLVGMLFFASWRDRLRTRIPLG